MIDLQKLLAETCVRHAEWLPEVDSTNDRALLLASDSALPVPFLIGTDRQTAGRGRGVNRWWGADGSLLFSICVEMPDFGLSTGEWPRFSLITGLAIAQTLTDFLPASTIGVKWPNDVWINGRKVCGILIEQADRAPNRLIVGIGINVNNSFSEAPDEQRAIATSMIDANDGTAFSRTEILISFLSRWRTLIAQLAEGEVSLAERWSHSCVLSGQAVTLTNGFQETTGICTGIDDDGSLLLRTGFAIERFYAGTVRLS